MKKDFIEPGKKYGYLTVICDSESRKMPSGRMERMIKCECECGKVLNIFLCNLKRRPKISCGCHKENIGANFFKHGLCTHSIYTRWWGVIGRCNNKNHPAYKDYGGRGITICKEWEDDFMNFYNWSINNGYQEDLELDR